ncbi:MAG: ABC transporter permease subunit [Propionibacteriales bacterium]|nr:ABC transporter permease subunit [Propionibacteriales bacterium]
MVGDAVAYLLDGAHWSGSEGIFAQLGQQLLLTITALAFATLLGLPLALWLGHLGRGGFLAINVSNIGRAVPTFAVLVLLSIGPEWGTDTLGPYGRAGLATLIALVLFALPPIITNAYVGIREVDRDIVEVSRGMGMSERQVFAEVELPLALPVVAAGVRLALVQVWATATIAALVAGPGLGTLIVAGFYNGNYGKGLAGAVVVAAFALVLEALAALAQRALEPGRRAVSHVSLSATGAEAELVT